MYVCYVCMGGRAPYSDRTRNSCSFTSSGKAKYIKHAYIRESIFSGLIVSLIHIYIYMRTHIRYNTYVYIRYIQIHYVGCELRQVYKHLIGVKMLSTGLCLDINIKKGKLLCTINNNVL